MSPLESLARRIEAARALDRWADLARSKAHEALVAPDTLDSVLGGGRHPAPHRHRHRTAATVTGAHDLGTTTGAATRVALVHAATMDGSLGLLGAAWVARRRGDRRTARRLALAGTALVGAGAYLGGHLVYRLGVGVDA